MSYKRTHATSKIKQFEFKPKYTALSWVAIKKTFSYRPVVWLKTRTFRQLSRTGTKQPSLAECRCQEKRGPAAACRVSAAVDTDQCNQREQPQSRSFSDIDLSTSFQSS